MHEVYELLKRWGHLLGHSLRAHPGYTGLPIFVPVSCHSVLSQSFGGSSVWQTYETLLSWRHPRNEPSLVANLDKPLGSLFLGMVLRSVLGSGGLETLSDPELRLHRV